jgi:hypothetical protein
VGGKGGERRESGLEKEKGRVQNKGSNAELKDKRAEGCGSRVE